MKVKKYVCNNVEELCEIVKKIVDSLKEESKKKHPEVNSLETMALSNLMIKFSCRNIDEFKAVFLKIADVNKGAALSLILREMALILDRRYPDNIRQCEEVWVLSLLNGKLYKVHRKEIRGYEAFAAFRTLDDAKTACRSLKYILKDMFGGK